jgi:hypothetical protein
MPPSPLRPGRPSVTFLPLAEAVGVENPDLTVGLDLLQRDAGNVVALFPALPRQILGQSVLHGGAGTQQQDERGDEQDRG